MHHITWWIKIVAPIKVMGLLSTVRSAMNIASTRSWLEEDNRWVNHVSRLRQSSSAEFLWISRIHTLCWRKLRGNITSNSTTHQECTGEPVGNIVLRICTQNQWQPNWWRVRLWLSILAYPDRIHSFVWLWTAHLTETHCNNIMYCVIYKLYVSLWKRFRSKTKGARTLAHVTWVETCLLHFLLWLSHASRQQYRLAPINRVTSKYLLNLALPLADMHRPHHLLLLPAVSLAFLMTAFGHILSPNDHQIQIKWRDWRRGWEPSRHPE